MVGRPEYLYIAVARDGRPHLPRRERSRTLSASQIWVVRVQVAGRVFRAAHCRRGSGLSEELRCRCVSCGEGVSGDEIVFVLEQVRKREAGQCDPGCLQVAGEAGALAVAGSEGFRRVRPEP